METTRQINYHFVPADYKVYDFKKLLDETKNNQGTIIWRNGSEGGKRAHQINVGDICYFYYSNLPDGTSRILLKGVVKDSDTDPSKIGENRLSYEGVRRGFWIGNIEAVALYDSEKFNERILKEKYFSIPGYGPRGINQGLRYLHNYPELLEDLLKNDEHTKLQGVIKYFEEHLKCYFSGKDGQKHATFIMAKGVPYAESHHFVKKSYLDKYDDMGWLVSEPNNLIRLCPTCHAQLHHGKVEDVVQRLNMIYEGNKEWYDENLIAYARRDNFDDVLSWIYAIYNEERKKNSYELIEIM